MHRPGSAGPLHWICLQSWGSVPLGERTIVAAFQTASPLLIQVFLLSNAVTPYFFPLSYIGLGLLAMKRSPWLATLGIAFGLVGSLPWGFFLPVEVLYYNIAQAGNSSASEALLHGISSEGIIIFFQYSWVIGHLLGYLLLGIALGRARAIPLWATCFIVSIVPCQIIAYPTHQSIFQNIGSALVFIGSIPAALAMLRTPGDGATLSVSDQPAVRNEV